MGLQNMLMWIIWLVFRVCYRSDLLQKWEQVSDVVARLRGRSRIKVGRHYYLYIIFA